MALPAARKVRVLPGKMTTFIGNFDTATMTFAVKVSLLGATDKEVKAAVQKLGHGKYDIMTGRTSSIEFKQITKDVIA